MTHTLLSDCYRDVGTGTAYKTGQRANISIIVRPTSLLHLHSPSPGCEFSCDLSGVGLIAH